MKIAIWAGVLGMTFEEREFPFYSYQRLELFTCNADIDRWVLSQNHEYYPHEYCALIKCEKYIFTPAIQEYLLRYKMQANFNIYSYSNNFDEIPSRWISMLNYIDNEINAARKERQRLGHS
jgi:hypothetical protein